MSSILQRVSRRLRSLPGKLWSLARRLALAEHGLDRVRELDATANRETLELPLAAGNPFLDAHELFDARVTAADPAQGTVTVRRVLPDGPVDSHDDPEADDPLTVGVLAGKTPVEGDHVRVWFAGLDDNDHPIYRTLGAADALLEVSNVFQDGDDQTVVNGFLVGAESDPGTEVTFPALGLAVDAYAIPQDAAAFPVGARVPLMKLGATWIAVAPHLGLRVTDGTDTIERAAALAFSSDFSVSAGLTDSEAAVHLKPAISAQARVAVRIDGGADIGPRRRLNFLNAGGTVAVEAGDSPAEEEIELLLIHDGRVKVLASGGYHYLQDAVSAVSPVNAALDADRLALSVDQATNASRGVVKGGNGTNIGVDGAVNLAFGLSSLEALEGSTASATPGTAGKVPLTGPGGTINPGFLTDASASAEGKVSLYDQTFAGTKSFQDGLRMPTGSDPASPSDGRIWHRNSDGVFVRDNGQTRRLVNVPDSAYSQGQLLFVGSDGKPQMLSPGTAGQTLQTAGAGADPAWAAPAAFDIHALASAVPAPADELPIRDVSASSDAKITLSRIGMRGYIDGLMLSNNASDANNDIDLAPGLARDSADACNIALASALTKRLDANWAAGTNQGGLDAGAKANSTWYHVWLIGKSSDGSADALLSTSASSPTLPSGWDLKRRVGSVRTDSSGNLIAFTQLGDEFLWLSPIADASLTNLGSGSGTLLTLTVPVGLSVWALVGAYASGSGENVYLSPPGVNDESLASSAPVRVTLRGNDARVAAPPHRIRTDASSRIRARGSAANCDLELGTHGWLDPRGRDSQ